MFQKASVKLKHNTQQLKTYCSNNDLMYMNERTSVMGYGRSEAGKVTAAYNRALKQEQEKLNKALDKTGGSGIIKEKKIYSFEDYADNPALFADISPSEMYSAFNESEHLIQPLGKGSFTGVPFEKVGGFRVFFDNSKQKMLMHHPENRSHHKGAYYKLSDGKFGTHRYNLDGTEKAE